jgi:hypothetical protein
VSKRSKEPRLLDHFIGEGEQLIWHRKAERLSGLQVEGQLYLVGSYTGNSAVFSSWRGCLSGLISKRPLAYRIRC